MSIIKKILYVAIGSILIVGLFKIIKRKPVVLLTQTEFNRASVLTPCSSMTSLDSDTIMVQPVL